jgi:protein-tyrosine phosphatase
MRICFVCLGNIVRSPLAENYFRHMVDEAGVADSYIIESAGTGDWHVGDPPDPRMRKVAANHGLLYTGRARHFKPGDFDRYDIIIAMDASNKSNLQRQAPSAKAADKIHLLREFDPFAESGASVPDPYYGGIDGFEKVFEIIERSCYNLLEVLESGKTKKKVDESDT